MAHTFTLTNAKGGCGKTTVALNLAICFSRAGYRTLAINLDQQGNLSAGLGVNLNKLSLTAHRLIINESPDVRRYLVKIRPQLHLLPNTIDIEADDLLEAKKVNRELLLRRQIRPVLSDFDVSLIDTPPPMRAATVNALVVVDSVIMTMISITNWLTGEHSPGSTASDSLSVPTCATQSRRSCERWVSKCCPSGANVKFCCKKT